jgi:shikimate 5-dehydrogenase
VATKDGKWKGYSALPRAVVQAFEDAMLARRPDEPPIEGKSILVIGASPTARAIATALRRKNAAVVVADKHNDRAQVVAQECGARYIPNGQAYSILVDGMILTADPDADEPNTPAIAMPTSVAREGMAVLDLSASPNPTRLLEEVRVRRGIPILPIDVLARTVELVLKAYSGNSPNSTELQSCFEDWDENYRFQAAED